MDEAQQADKRAWEVIADLCNLHQRTLDKAIYEGTEVRSELSALLAPRPAMPKAPAPPLTGFPHQGRGRGNKGKGKEGRGKSSSGKGQGNRSSSVPGGKWLSALYENGQRKTICVRFQTEEGCHDAHCKYLHVCAVPTPEGRPCAGKHPACRHKSTLY